MIPQLEDTTRLRTIGACIAVMAAAGDSLQRDVQVVAMGPDCTPDHALALAAIVRLRIALMEGAAQLRALAILAGIDDPAEMLGNEEPG